jgi:hypothetical protein
MEAGILSTTSVVLDLVHPVAETEMQFIYNRARGMETSHFTS